MTINKLIIDFLEYLEIEKGRTITTSQNYHRYLEKFKNFSRYQHIEKAEEIDLNLIRRYFLTPFFMEDLYSLYRLYLFLLALYLERVQENYSNA